MRIKMLLESTLVAAVNTVKFHLRASSTKADRQGFVGSWLIAPQHRKGNMQRRLRWLMLAAAAAAPAFASSVSVDLGSSSTFGLLGSTITSTGNSNVTGDVGATTTLTLNAGFTATGTIYPAGAPTVITAYNDFQSAFSSAAALTPTMGALSNLLTANQTFVGNNVYTFSGTNISTTAGITLTFDAQGNANEVFVIQVPGSLTVNGPVTFNLTDGAQADNIFWIIGTSLAATTGSAATIDPSSAITFDGNILAGGSGGTFTMSAPASGTLSGEVDGCVFTGAANTLAAGTNVDGCSAYSVNGASSSDAPEPGSSALVGLACLLGILAWRKSRSVSSARRLG
jgi:hypothetical protein